MLAGYTQKETDRENFETCKRIAQELEAFAEGRYIKCPECGEWIEAPEDDDEKITCPECGETIDADEAECSSIYDYFDNTELYDIEYTCGSKKEYRGVRLMVACGGPNIYIDTMEKAVKLYWWTDRAEYALLSDTVEAIDQYFEELFECC